MFHEKNNFVPDSKKGLQTKKTENLKR